MENDISKPWPKMVDFEQTEAGWNTYLDAWINRKRQASRLAQIPIASIDEHRAAYQITMVIFTRYPFELSGYQMSVVHLRV